MRFCSGLIAALLFVSAHAVADVRAWLKPNAAISGSRVRFGDVASLESDGDSTQGELAAAELGNAPLPGYSSRLTREEIQRLVRARFPNRIVNWGGADSVYVERIALPLDSARINETASSYLGRLLQKETDRFELQVVDPQPDIQIPVGKVELRPRPLEPARALRQRVTVWVDVLIDGVFFRTVPISLNVQAYRTALVLKRDLPKGVEPSCASLEARQVDVAALSVPLVSADCQVVEGRLKHALPQGSTLLKSDLEVVLPVAQGDSVSLQMSKGVLVLESRATALTDGQVGERVEVRPSGATGSIVAEVVAPGVVKVSEK